ncbi:MULTISPECIES: DUF523 domain-containing protein [unclassified Fusibacter]|uniref:DUF523 domain-containing protein n=1 Tax=unclassified Fusibacter TaxID=2624464 RepID=UPI001012D9B5|nr:MULTISPECIES: DUF523 domain-containing protein [unclassified Fusibacter]MCK8060114.1 DUF523 domain-containing protein [Fusibacter sp. A2]NPE22256.1 DUF523 domain-containing protein [Fusibacter sp. A1]RXV61030.1 DUF523 domain-containing protein [Fusibacter sp. A1]
MIIVSACLAGCECRYDGKGQADERVVELISRGEAHPVCPEQLGGLTTPREPCEIRLSKGQVTVVTKDGEDRTSEFRLGAERTLAIAKALGATKAILKAKSPSCGRDMVYDGSFSGTLTGGRGLTADLLMKHGIKVLTEKEELV